MTHRSVSPGPEEQPTAPGPLEDMFLPKSIDLGQQVPDEWFSQFLSVEKAELPAAVGSGTSQEDPEKKSSVLSH